MVFSYNWLQSFFQKRLPTPQRLAELLTLHFAEVEEIKKVGSDFALNIDVRPNRASDCFSHMGIAREISAICGLKYQNLPSKFRELKNKKAKDFVSVKFNEFPIHFTVEVKNKRACPRYSAKVITDVKVGPSPKWIQDKLKVCGLRPINNIVDIANYVMLETGQPLHAFDGQKLEGRKIIVRFAKEREKIITLDEEKYDLDENILVIADVKKPVAIAGIKGGKLPEIDKKTKIVVLESANFNPQVIRKGSKKLNLKTDASLRFEHGIDPNLTEFAINRAAFLIQKIAEGKVSYGLVDVYNKKVLPQRIKLDLNYVEKLLGVKVPKKEIKNILKKLGFQCKSTRDSYDEEDKSSSLPFAAAWVIEVLVPTRRLDISIQEDLIEEIGRIYGYDKIPCTSPISSLFLPQKNLNIFWEDFTKNILKEAGFTEVYNYSFFGEEEAKLFGYRASEGSEGEEKDEVLFAHKEEELIEVENPLSQEYKYLRASLIPNLLKNVEKNQRYFPEMKIFELGKIFQPPEQQRRGKKKIYLLRPPKSENRILVGVITGDAFYEVKGVVDLLLNKLGIANICRYDEYPNELKKSKTFWLHPQKCAEIKVDHQKIGLLGEVSPKILSRLDIKERTVLFDIDFEKLSQLASEEHEYRPISKFPSAVRDIAVLVSRNVKIAEVLNKIYDTGGKIIRDVDLFDIYEGEEIPAGKKNLAFHIIYQAQDRTLSSEEIDELQNKIIKILEKNPEWTVRK
ncbi:MAG: phenylalanine--tRNA ligase subunit beta [Candidatus Nealsonbacteria bacterium]|nr:phenylalanine--tRNA ligase subunit beta [Candidatus Nealsonbacteria bacterium]